MHALTEKQKDLLGSLWDRQPVSTSQLAESWSETMEMLRDDGIDAGWTGASIEQIGETLRRMQLRRLVKHVPVPDDWEYEGREKPRHLWALTGRGLNVAKHWV